ncbi:helix-turn-helix domain-containing protein [Streptomyces sioyaensis]|uniref:helix-turn-helix domain-containing protein n=1 Tax=Streptomyces sioyaensis TaxID=67364 RepID=UPI0037AEE01E
MALPPDLREQVERLLREGCSDLDIQRRLGVGRGTAARYRKRLGLPGFRTSIDSPSCRYGHPFPENADRDGNGWLICRACLRDRSRNKRRSYVPVEPDWAVIERAVAGECPERITPRERAAAVRRLEAQRLNAELIAERVRCHPRTVFRIRSRSASGQRAA